MVVIEDYLSQEAMGTEGTWTWSRLCPSGPRPLPGQQGPGSEIT